MPKLTFISVGTTKNSHFKALEEDYFKRLSHYTEVTQLIVSDSKKTNQNQKIAEESSAISQKIPSGSFIILLDIMGKTLSTEELANKINHWNNTSVNKLTLIVGGAYGVSEDLKKMANLKLSLSPMTFPHELARVLLVEQMYRAHTILKGEKYHH